MNRYPRATSALGRLALVVTLAALGACDGSSDKKFSIGGTASGLTGAVVLQNNGGDNLTVGGNGSFTFSKKVKKGHAYLVTILSKPATQTCAIENGSGNATDNVTNVTLTCTTNASYTVGGSVTGLGSGKTVVLRNNGGDDLTINADGPFTFATPVISGTGYAVTVQTQPAGQTCTVTAGSGTVNGADVNSVAVNCADIQYFSIIGNVTGLTGGTLQLGLTHPGNMGNSIDISADGPFTFDPDKVADGDTYAVTVATQPAGQTCTVTHGSGTVAGANVTNVAVACSSSTALYSVGGTITGLTADGLTLEDNLPGSQAVAANATTFVLPNKVQTNYEYNVGIATQPTGQTCVITKSHGIVASADVTNVKVECIANVTDPIVGTYTVPALSAAGISYVYVTFFADGVYIYGSVENNGTNCDTSLAIAGNGVEYGVYNYKASNGAFAFKSAVVDTNGRCGVWDTGTGGTNASRYDGTLTVGGTAGQGRTLHLVTSAGAVDLVPVDSTSGQIIGSWGDKYHKNFAAFLPDTGNNMFTFFAESQADTAGPTDTGQLAGIEYACASADPSLSGTNLTPDFNPATCQAPAPDTNGPVDTNGTAGLSNAGSPIPFTVNADSLTTPGGVLTRIKPN